MAGGSRGLCGQAVPKRVVVGVSKGTDFVMGPFLEGIRVLETERRCGAAVRRDAQVSGSELSEQDPPFIHSMSKNFICQMLTRFAVRCKILLNKVQKHY